MEKAQQKVEARNFDIRKNLLKFDDVMNDQRKVIYEQRKELMQATDVAETVQSMRHEVIEDLVARCIPERAYAEQWDVQALHEEVLRIFNMNLPIQDWAKEEGIADAEIRERIIDATDRKMAEKVANYGAEVWRMVEKSMLLQLLDQQWKDHLLTLDHLRQGVHLRAYAQRDPLNEYKREAFNLFEAMLDGLRDRITSVLAHIELRIEQTPPEALQPQAPRVMHESRQDPALAGMEDGDTAVAPQPVRTAAAPSRNAPCPCGSGKKYKHCHGKVA